MMERLVGIFILLCIATFYLGEVLLWILGFFVAACLVAALFGGILLALLF